MEEILKLVRENQPKWYTREESIQEFIAELSRLVKPKEVSVEDIFK